MRSKYPGRESRKTMQKRVVKDKSFDLGVGSEIYYISYNINGISGKTCMCPNNADFFWLSIKRKHKIKTIKDFSYKIEKQVGKSFYY